MAESNATQVILTDDGLKIIKAQNTADKATSGVTNLNDPNLMSVIEKQTQAAQYAGLTSQYNVILKRAKDANINTTDLTTAYTNLNAFMAAILTDTTKASDVDRKTYKSLIDAYNTALSNVQNALSNNFNTDISNMQSNVSTASQAASSAAVVASQAAATGNSASQAASQAVVVANQAQSAGNNATSVANSASQAVSSAVLAGSQAAVSASQASADYQTLSAGVKDGSVVHITTETVIDKGVIGTAEIANGAITNAQIGSEAVGTAQIANLAVGTAQIGDGAITNAKIANLAVGTAQIANAAITDAQVGNVSANKLTAGTIDFNTITGKNINASNITTGKMSADRLDVGKLSAVSADLGDVTTGSLKGVDIVAKTFSTPNGSFTTDANGAVVASNLTIRGVTNLVYNAALLGNNGSYIPGWNISNNGICWPNVIHDGVPSIGWNNTTGAGVWTNFAQTKLHPLNGATGQPYSASVWFKEYGSDTSLIWDLTLAFFDSNGNRIESANGLNNWNGIGSQQDWRYVTINNAVAPSNAAYVGLQYFAYNGHGNACFSSPMLTQTAQSTGYQPDTGNVISAGEIDGSVINGATINTPNLQLGTNGTLTEDWALNQDTSLFNPKKGSGTMTLTKGILATSGTLSRWWSGDGGYWYGIGDDGFKIKDGSNQVGDNYGAGYAQHNIFDSKGNTLFRTYMDATGIYMNNGGTTAVNTLLTQQGLTTTNIDALGTITGDSIQTQHWIDAGLSAGHGIRIGQQTVQSHNSQDIYFNGDDNKQSVTIHTKAIIQSSQLSRKKDIIPLDPDYAMKVIRDSDMYGYRYNEEAPTEPLHYSGIIDDVNGTPQFKMPDEFISEDRTGRNDGNTVAFLVEALKQADKRIGILEGMMNRD